MASPPPYEETFGGHVWRHCESRSLTTTALAAHINKVIKEETITGDTVALWQSNGGVPRSQNVLDALTSVLIDKNPKIPDGNKEAAKREFMEAYRVLVIWLRTPNPSEVRTSAPTAWGELVVRYKRELGDTEDKLAVRVTRAMAMRPKEKPGDITPLFMQNIIVGRIGCSAGLVEAMLQVFSRTNAKGDMEPVAPEDDSYLTAKEETDFRAAFDRRMGKAPAALPAAQAA